MNKMFELFKDLDMENIVIVMEVIRAVTGWEYQNKYYNGKVQVIRLNNFEGEIYIAHNLYDELEVVDSYTYLQELIDVLKEYADTPEREEYMKEYWTKRLTEILEMKA